jgi:hypothetical protein
MGTGHALGRRQPRLFAIKLGPAKGKGLSKFREQDSGSTPQIKIVRAGPKKAVREIRWNRVSDYHRGT